MNKGKLFVISGPSGAGKGTIISRLMEADKSLVFSVSATTRAPRPGEVDGVHYHFLRREQFQKWVDEDAFLEYAQFVGNCYGTPKFYVDQAMEQGRDVILDIEIQGADQVHTKRPETVRIFLAPPSWEEPLTSTTMPSLHRQRAVLPTQIPPPSVRPMPSCFTR